MAIKIKAKSNLDYIANTIEKIYNAIKDKKIHIHSAELSIDLNNFEKLSIEYFIDGDNNNE